MATASKTFNREDRYLVFKRKDMAKYLSKEGQGQLLYFADKIALERRLDGRVEMNCVVVEHDWPEAVKAKALVKEGKMIHDFLRDYSYAADTRPRPSYGSFGASGFFIRTGGGSTSSL